MKRILVLALGMAVASAAWAHGDAQHAKKGPRKISADEHSFGREGDPKKVSRTVKVEMADTMRYSPSEITVKLGDTVRIEAKNAGKTMHEIVLGTMNELEAHS